MDRCFLTHFSEIRPQRIQKPGSEASCSHWVAPWPLEHKKPELKTRMARAAPAVAPTGLLAVLCQLQHRVKAPVTPTAGTCPLGCCPRGWRGLPPPSVQGSRELN